jgi:hypothetical protein
MSLGVPVADHPYVKANGAKGYSAPKSVTALGGSTLPDMVKVGDDNIPVGQFVSAAQLTSGLSIDAWNRLEPAARDDMVARMIKARQDTVIPKPAAARDDPANMRQDPFRDANYRREDGNTAVDLMRKPVGNAVVDQEGKNDVAASQAQQVRDDKAAAEDAAKAKADAAAADAKDKAARQTK